MLSGVTVMSTHCFSSVLKWSGSAHFSQASFLEHLETNKQTNGWVNRNILARTIACSWRRSLDKRRLQSAAARLVQASVSMIFLFPVHSDQCMSNIHRYPQSPKMDQQYKMLLMLLITLKVGRMNSYTTQWHKCVDLYLCGYEWPGLLFIIYTW